MQMNPLSQKRKINRVSFEPLSYHEFWKPDLSGLRQSEREAYELIMEFLDKGSKLESDKLYFLRAVETLSSAVHSQADSNMNDFFPKIFLANKIEELILEEPTEILNSNLRQQAMLCTVALSQVNPPFNLSQKLNLVNASIASVFSLPLIMPSLDRKDSASLYLQTVQALDEMLQVLVMENLKPDMLILQHFLEIILPWLTMSDRAYQQIRALGTTSRLLRFICNFPELSHVALFSLSGKLMGISGLLCMSSNHEVSKEASEALHYLCKILVLQRSVKQKTEAVLKDLQKHFRRGWLASMQDLTMFFRKYLTPLERADLIMVAMKAMTSSNSQEVHAASKMLKMILKYILPEIGKVSEIIQYIYFYMNNITENTAQNIIRKILCLLAQSYTDEVILTLFKIEDKSQKGTHKPWEILASFPKGYEVIMEHLRQRLIPQQAADHQDEQEPGQRAGISPVVATRAIQELLLEPSRRMEVQAFFSSLFLALLFQVSFFVTQGSSDTTQDEPLATEWTDPLSSTMEAMKTLMRTSGYGEQVSYIQALGGWKLLVTPERHFDGIALLARTLVIKNCWHNRPIFSLIIRTLQDPDCTNHKTALVFLRELLQCSDVASIVDDIAVYILAEWFKSEDPVTVKLLLQVIEVFTKHKNMVKRLQILQPYMLSCCYSSNRDVVVRTFLVLQHLLDNLSWQHGSSFLSQLAFTMVPFLEEESDQLRLMAFQIYGGVLSKMRKRDLVFPLKHQVVNLVVLTVMHLKDVRLEVAQVSRTTFCHTVTLLGWSKLKDFFKEEDIFTILRALLEQNSDKALWFLRQCVFLFKSPQVPIRQAAVWFAGQITQTLNLEEMEEVEDAYTALQHMQRDPDPAVSCLATQILYILAAKNKSMLASATSCFLRRRRTFRSL